MSPLHLMSKFLTTDLFASLEQVYNRRHFAKDLEYVNEEIYLKMIWKMEENNVKKKTTLHDLLHDYKWKQRYLTISENNVTWL